MIKPKICAVIISPDMAAIKSVESMVSLFEVRIDLVGKVWKEVAGQLKKPWIACNRRAEEGGAWQDTESKRIMELLAAVEIGAPYVDLELEMPQLAEVLRMVKRRARCVLSYHDLKETPPLDTMKELVRRQMAAGAGICKVVTTANSLNDNVSVLRLITESPKARVVSFAMGPLGFLSRVLCPVVGGEFTYASMGEGSESAPGQVAVDELTKIYRMMARG